MLVLEELCKQHKERLIRSSTLSKELHAEWVTTPSTPEEFESQLKRYDSGNNIGFVTTNESQELVAWISISEIVRGGFQSGYLGYCVFRPFDAQHMMSESLKLVISHAFDKLDLHRLEANIQPENIKSIRLVESLGFKLEGFSPSYLYINGEWKDHNRYAIISEEFNR